MLKYLGMWIQSDLKEDIVVEKVEDKLVGWLKTIDSAPLDGRMKVWIVNFQVGVAAYGSKLVGDNRSWLAETHPPQVSQVAGAR